MLILTDPSGNELYYPQNINDSSYARNYIDFEGRITGTHANVGLYATTAIDIPYSRRIFRSADVDIENLIVYGPAQLNVGANTNLSGVKNIWLRSHRPGAANFNADGSVNSAIAYSILAIGKVNLIPGEANTDIHIQGLKVYGTSSFDDMGSINVREYDYDAVDAESLQAPRDYTKSENRENGKLGPRINAYLGNIELYANKGTNRDFLSGYANPVKGIYALRINATAQPSRIIIDGTTVTGDGLAEDFDDKFHQVEISSGSDVTFTGLSSGAQYYPLARNNSLLAKSNAKLEIQRGGIIDGYLTFEPGTNDSLPSYGSDEWPADSDFEADDGWYDRNLQSTLLSRLKLGQ